MHKEETKSYNGVVGQRWPKDCDQKGGGSIPWPVGSIWAGESEIAALITTTEQGWSCLVANTSDWGCTGQHPGGNVKNVALLSVKPHPGYEGKTDEQYITRAASYHLAFESLLK